jgi:hypothetical protein
MCHIASDRKISIVRTIPAAIVAILPTIMTFSIHVKSFSCPDDHTPTPASIISPQRNDSDRPAVPEKQERRGRF